MIKRIVSKVRSFILIVDMIASGCFNWKFVSRCRWKLILWFENCVFQNVSPNEPQLCNLWFLFFSIYVLYYTNLQQGSWIHFCNLWFVICFFRSAPSAICITDFFVNLPAIGPAAQLHCPASATITLLSSPNDPPCPLPPTARTMCQKMPLPLQW